MSDLDRGRVMALDLGKARTGVAISDPTWVLATPYEPVRRAASSAGMASIARMVAAHEVQRIVVGLPVPLAGGQSAQTQRAQSFADRLRSVVDVPVELYDERFTTRMAAATAAETGTTTAGDSLAACHLLESWMEAHGR